MFAIYRKYDRFCEKIQVAVHRMQMLFHLWHLGQRCKYYPELEDFFIHENEIHCLFIYIYLIYLKKRSHNKILNFLNKQ